jgi:hypothetical protein
MTAGSAGDLPTAVRLTTQLVRTGDDQLYSRLRQVFIERQIATSLFDEWPEDGALEAGFVVTAAGRVFSFEFEYFDWKRRVPDLPGGVITSWDDVTDQPEHWYPRDSVEAALAFQAAGLELSSAELE